VAELWVTALGVVPYREGVALQERLRAARQREAIPDCLLLLEHPPVYTRGRRARPADLPMGEDWYRAQGIEVLDSDRGGQVTYHGPGQLVGYPIMRVRSAREFVHTMESAMIAALEDEGIPAGKREGLTGVWVAAGGAQPDRRSGEHRPTSSGGAQPDRRSGEHRTEVLPAKIGSIGVHVSRGVTTHGFAINVDNDLQPFQWILACGAEGARMTSVSAETGRSGSLGCFRKRVAWRFAEAFGLRQRVVSARRLHESAVVATVEAAPVASAL
jgi:lipoyl(octanoyl) transferase